METETKPPGRGGKRPGSGRKLDNDTPAKPRLVTLDQASVDRLTVYGDGNLSLGIRLAARLIDSKLA